MAFKFNCITGVLDLVESTSLPSDVVTSGSGSSVNGAVAVFSGTSGTVIVPSSVIVDSSGDITTPGTIMFTGGTDIDPGIYTSTGSGNTGFFFSVNGATFAYNDAEVANFTNQIWKMDVPIQLFINSSPTAPGIFFLNDSNTGFYHPATGQWSWSSGGTDVLNLLSSGAQVIGTITASEIVDNGLNPNTVVYADSGSQLTSSVTTNTELGYVSGVTSSIQTQINGKQALLTFSNSLVNNSGVVTLVNDSATPGNTKYYGTNGSGTLGYYSIPATGVSSVGVADTSTTPIYTVSNSPITSSGTIDLTLNTQSANEVFAGPSSGSAAEPAFRALVANDIPTLNQNTTGTASNVTGTVAIANGGTGQTTQQLALNALAGAVTSGEYLRGNGTNVVMSTIQAGDLPSLSGTYVTQSEVGAASGVASLDGTGKVPLTQLPAAVFIYQGVWNPSTNTPTLIDGTGVTGYVYWVSTAFAGPVAGLSNASMINFEIGDLVVYNGTQWELTTPAAGVQSVNGAQGVVTVNAINQLTGDVTTSAASGSQSKVASLVATSNSTLTTLSSLSLPGSQVTGNISGNAANITSTSNSTLTTLSALSLPGSQVTGNISGNAANVTGVVAVVNGGTGTTTSTGTGSVVLSSAPTLTNPTVGTQSSTDNSTLAASTAYVTAAVNNAIAGVNPAVAVNAATTTAANTSGLTYNNGVGGVGATFTGPTNTALTVDGFTFTALGQRLLVKNDTQSPSGAFNGIYYVTQLQTSLLPLILTRALDYDQPSDMNNTGAIPVISGTVNGSTSWLLTSTVVTVGTTPLTYTQFSINPSTIQTALSSTTPVSHQFLTGFTAPNTFTQAQPAFTDISGVATIAQGGTDNGSLAVTAGGVIYTDGTKFQNVGAGSSGQLLQSGGASAPSWITSPAGATVAMYVTGTSTSFTMNANTTAIFSTVVKDTNSAYSNSTGVYTIPLTGYYHFTCYIEANGNVTASGLGSSSAIQLFQNGSRALLIGAFNAQTTSGNALSMNGAGTIFATAGDLVKIVINNGSSIPTWTGDSTANFTAFMVH
jgi:hypothetical protein